MTDLFKAPTASELAEAGMTRALEHADAVSPRWSDQAYELLEGYALCHFEFMGEDVRKWAHEQGLPLPPDPRAWGGVIVQASRSKIIVCDRYQKTRIPPAHSTPRPVWRSQIFVELAA